MDNITHSLVGAALAEVALRDRATPTQRRLFFAAGVVSSNLPDLDLLVTGLTPPPLGYLLHHRGHTHTLVGLVAQGLVAWALCWLLPVVRRLAAADRARLLALMAGGLGGHLLLLRAGQIRDLRFETPAGGNFTALRLRPASEAAECPPHLTRWAMPRADLLDAAR